MLTILKLEFSGAGREKSIKTQGLETSPSFGWQVMSVEKEASFSCFYSSPAWDTVSVGWKEPNIREKERLSELRDQFGERSKKLETQMNADPAGPTGLERRFSRHQGRRGNDFAQHQAVPVQARMRLSAEAFYQKLLAS